MVDRPALPSALKKTIDTFDKWSMRQIHELSKTTKPLYHYTNAAGLLGIVQSEEIWFTSYLHLNDPSELSYGIEIAKQVLAKVGKAGSSQKVIQNFCERAVNLLEPTYLSCFSFFVSSFSRQRDDLAQWRAYADNGRGFALGLAPRLFGEIKPDPKGPYFGNVFYGPVVYGEDQARKRHKKPIQKAASLVAKATSGRNTSPSVRDQFLMEMAYYLMVPLIWNCLTSKHDAYENESEERLIIFGEANSLAQQVETRMRNNSIVPFMKNKAPIRQKGRIVEIVIGPSAPIRTENAVRALLRRFDPNTKIPIRQSHIPYHVVS